jgi:hypothetical protein
MSVEGCATLSVSMSRSLRETLDTRMCSSWKPRQVPWICGCAGNDGCAGNNKGSKGQVEGDKFTNTSVPTELESLLQDGPDKE